VVFRLAPRSTASIVGLLLAASTVACADESSVRVKVAQGFTPGPTNVSVLGVFRDGRMSVDAWGPIAIPLSAAIGGLSMCEPAFSARLQRENEPLFASIDDEAKSDGITEDLLTKLAPAAQGDQILAITMHGSVGGTTDKASGLSTPHASAPQTRGMGGGGMRGNRGMQQREPTTRGPSPKALEMSATLFSARLHQPMARVTVIYTGTNADEAVRQFTAEIGKIVPGSACKGWSWPANALPPSVAPLLDGP
jgi:hypothetical protein